MPIIVGRGQPAAVQFAGFLSVKLLMHDMYPVTPSLMSTAAFNPSE
jgi:hypothetical protein